MIPAAIKWALAGVLATLLLVGLCDMEGAGLALR